MVLLTSNGGLPPFSWKIASGELPQGLELTPSGLLRGTPTRPGFYTFGVKVDDSSGNAASEFFTLDFYDPLYIETDFLVSPTVGSVVEEDLLASGGLEPYIWKLLSGSLPDGILLSENGKITGKSQETSENTFILGLSDSAGKTVEKSFKLSVVDPVTISNFNLPDALTGVEYFVELNATGGTPPYFWELVSGSLPDGLEIASDGNIQGTSQNSIVSEFNVRVTDSEGKSTSLPYSLRVSIGLGERQTILARGGTAIIEIKENMFNIIEIYSNDGFEMYEVTSSPEKLQFHFIGRDGQIPSWILCEINLEKKCDFD